MPSSYDPIRWLNVLWSVNVLLLLHPEYQDKTRQAQARFVPSGSYGGVVDEGILSVFSFEAHVRIGGADGMCIRASADKYGTALTLLWLQ